MYTVEIIKKNEFDCNWTTLFVGRQFKLISTLEVINYVIAYLEKNPNVDEEDIFELAWEQPEDKVDDLLEKIASDKSSEAINKEYHKWLYSILKEVYNKSSDDNIFREIESVFSMFNSPATMYDFFRKVSDAIYYPSDSSYTIKELVEEFLESERQLILNY